MRLQNVDLNLFVVFDAIYTERNLTRAAEVLHITQPAASNALTRLRRTMNDELFVRSRQGVIPTPVADNIIGRVREALQLMTSSLVESETFNPETAEKTFRVSMNDMAEALFLPSLEKYVQKNAPHITIESYYTDRQNVSRELSAGTIDLALDVPLLSDPQLRHKELLKENYVCMVRKGHQSIGTKLTLKSYLNLDHIHVSSRRTGPGQVEIALNKMGKHRRVSLRVQHYMIAALIAQQTDLALTLPTSLAKRYDTQTFVLPYKLAPLELHLYWHKSADNDPGNLWFRDQFLTALE